jgi:hypothetical protein
VTWALLRSATTRRLRSKHLLRKAVSGIGAPKKTKAGHLTTDTDIASLEGCCRQMAMEPYLNPFWQGLYAFNDGSSLEACPFPRQSDAARFWYEGFALAHALVYGRGRKSLR